MEIKVSGHSHNLKATIKYIDPKGNKAHKNSNGVIKRNKLLSGLNGVRTDTRQHIYKDMAQWNLLRPNNKVKCTNVVISFSLDELNFDNPEDVYRGLWIARRFGKLAFPNHAMLLAPQNDNKNKISHIHLITDQINENTHLGLTGKDYGIQRLRRIGNMALKEYNQNPKFNGYKKVKHLTRKGKRPLRTDEKTVLKRLKPVIKNPSITSKSKFRRACKAHGIKAVFRRHRHYVTKKGKDGKKHYVKDSKGKRRYHRSYGLVYKPLNVRGYVRASDLSRFDPTFSYENITNLIKANKKLNKSKSAYKNRKKDIQMINNTNNSDKNKNKNKKDKDNNKKKNKNNLKHYRDLINRVNRQLAFINSKENQIMLERIAKNDEARRKYVQQKQDQKYSRLERQIKYSKSNFAKSNRANKHASGFIGKVIRFIKAFTSGFSIGNVKRRFSKAYKYFEKALRHVSFSYSKITRCLTNFRKTATKNALRTIEDFKDDSPQL